MANVESVLFNGIVFRRYPEAETWAERSYFVPDGNARKRGVGRLHQEIWKMANGDIPPGHHVHHSDGNPLNNDLSNLECLSGLDHHHQHNPPGVTPPWVDMEAIRAKASEWHGSPEGRAWHSEHGKATWVDRQPDKRQCEQCGADFEDISYHARFCSNKCKSAFRRASGVDEVERTCAKCGQPFRCDRYARTKCCSRSCGHVDRKPKVLRLQPDGS